MLAPVDRQYGSKQDLAAVGGVFPCSGMPTTSACMPSRAAFNLDRTLGSRSVAFLRVVLVNAAEQDLMPGREDESVASSRLRGKALARITADRYA